MSPFERLEADAYKATGDAEELAFRVADLEAEVERIRKEHDKRSQCLRMIGAKQIRYRGLLKPPVLQFAKNSDARNRPHKTI